MIGTIIVETERLSLKSMKDTEHLNYSINQHMKSIKEHSDSKKIIELFQVISEYSVKHSGMSFMNNKTMAKKLKVSVRSIQRYTKLLEELRIMLKIPTKRKGNRGQTSNTYVILPVIKSVVSRVCHGVCHPFNPSSKPLKQESNNIENDDIKRMIELKINDAIKRGTSIKCMSSYVGKVFKSLERQAIYREAMKQDAIRKQREDQQSLKTKELLGIKESKIDFDLLQKMITD